MGFVARRALESLTVHHVGPKLEEREAMKGFGDEIPKWVWATAQRLLIVIKNRAGQERH